MRKRIAKWLRSMAIYLDPQQKESNIAKQPARITVDPPLKLIEITRRLTEIEKRLIRDKYGERMLTQRITMELASSLISHQYVLFRTNSDASGEVFVNARVLAANPLYSIIYEKENFQ